MWGLCGGLALGLAVVGAVLPLLPTVPFLLLAALCFSKASDRWHRWLLSHPRFGPPIRDWRARGAVSRRAKMFASIWMALALALSLAVGVPIWAMTAQTMVLICVAVFLWTRPD
nr:YbaN family protein [Falsirhodobacter halotolerans]